jgi:predicted nucleic acid-binding protein
VNGIYQLDACAMLTLFDMELGFEKVRDLLRRASIGELTIYMSAVNLTEVIYDLLPQKTETEMDEIWRKIYAMPLTIIRDISDSIIKDTSRFKVTYRIALADVFGLALAKSLGAVFVTSDHSEMEQIEEHESISFLWLPAKPKK